MKVVHLQSRSRLKSEYSVDTTSYVRSIYVLCLRGMDIIVRIEGLFKLIGEIYQWKKLID